MLHLHSDEFQVSANGYFYSTRVGLKHKLEDWKSILMFWKCKVYVTCKKMYCKTITAMVFQVGRKIDSWASGTQDNIKTLQ